MQPEQFELLPPLREQVQTWRGKRIDNMTHAEAIKALKECTTAYRDHLKDEQEVWERQQKWGYGHRPQRLSEK